MNDPLDTTRPPEGERRPIVSVRNGEAFASSRDVATFFDKEHFNVLRDIGGLLKSEDTLGLRDFVVSAYIDGQNGQSYRCYDMTRKGFMLLAMGFNGAKALKLKLRYIDQFDAMETELRSRPAVDPMTMLNDPAAMRGLLLTYSEKVIQLEGAVEAAKPKTVFYDQFADADGLYTLQNAGRILTGSPNKFIGSLKQGYLFYQGGNLVPKVQYREQGIFEVKVTLVDDKSRPQTFMTPKGMQYFAKKMGKPLDLFGRSVA